MYINTERFENEDNIVEYNGRMYVLMNGIWYIFTENGFGVERVSDGTIVKDLYPHSQIFLYLCT